MEPSQVAARLRSIADQIDASSRPERARVASAIRSVLTGMRTASFVVPNGLPGLLEQKIRKFINDNLQNFETVVGNLGSGLELFPDVPELDESSWSIEKRSANTKGRPSMYQYVIHGNVKRDQETLYESEMNGRYNVGKMVKVIIDDAQAMAQDAAGSDEV